MRSKAKIRVRLTSSTIFRFFFLKNPFTGFRFRVFFSRKSRWKMLRIQFIRLDSLLYILYQVIHSTECMRGNWKILSMTTFRFLERMRRTFFRSSLSNCLKIFGIIQLLRKLEHCLSWSFTRIDLFKNKVAFTTDLLHATSYHFQRCKIEEITFKKNPS